MTVLRSRVSGLTLRRSSWLRETVGPCPSPRPVPASSSDRVMQDTALTISVLLIQDHCNFVNSRRRALNSAACSSHPALGGSPFVLGNPTWHMHTVRCPQSPRPCPLNSKLVLIPLLLRVLVAFKCHFALESTLHKLLVLVIAQQLRLEMSPDCHDAGHQRVRFRQSDVWRLACPNGDSITVRQYTLHVQLRDRSQAWSS